MSDDPIDALAMSRPDVTIEVTDTEPEARPDADAGEMRIDLRLTPERARVLARRLMRACEAAHDAGDRYLRVGIRGDLKSPDTA